MWSQFPITKVSERQIDQGRDAFILGLIAGLILGMALSVIFEDLPIILFGSFLGIFVSVIAPHVYWVLGAPTRESVVFGMFVGCGTALGFFVGDLLGGTMLSLPNQCGADCVWYAQ